MFHGVTTAHKGREASCAALRKTVTLQKSRALILKDVNSAAAIFVTIHYDAPKANLRETHAFLARRCFDIPLNAHACVMFRSR